MLKISINKSSSHLYHIEELYVQPAGLLGLGRACACVTACFSLNKLELEETQGNARRQSFSLGRDNTHMPTNEQIRRQPETKYFEVINFTTAVTK